MAIVVEVGSGAVDWGFGEKAFMDFVERGFVEAGKWHADGAVEAYVFFAMYEG